MNGWDFILIGFFAASILWAGTLILIGLTA